MVKTMISTQTNVLNVPVGFNPGFKIVNECKKRYRVLKGSAGSGKSVNIAQDYIIKLGDKKYKGANLMVVRKVDDTNRDSTFAELQAAIFKIYGQYYEKYWKITTSPLALESKVTGNKVIFRGCNDAKAIEKIKSVSFKKGKLVWIWIEEATELTVDAVDILDDRLRGDLSFNPNLYYQMTFTFNPISATHWIKSRYFDKEDPDVLAHHSTYRENRFIDDGYRRRMERRKIEDPEGYRIYGLGEWGEVGGLILTNYTIHDFDTNLNNFDDNYLCQDFGFNHANAIYNLSYKDDEIYIFNETYLYEKDTQEIINSVDGKYDKTLEMWCDSAEPDRIKMWKKAGYRAKGVSKDKNSVHAQIDFLKGHKIHIHPSCIWAIKEINQWKWKKDEKLGVYLDEPVAFFDDAMAAIRYGIERIRRYKSIEVLR